MQGPCEQVCKVFLMEEDLGEEVTYDVDHTFTLLQKYDSLNENVVTPFVYIHQILFSIASYLLHICAL